MVTNDDLDSIIDRDYTLPIYLVDAKDGNNTTIHAAHFAYEISANGLTQLLYLCIKVLGGLYLNFLYI